MTPPEEAEDLTRKQRREQAREQRKAAEEAEAANQAKRRRLTQLGIVSAVVVVAIVVIAVAASSGSKKPPAQGSTAEKTAISKVNTTIAGIPQQGSVLGSPTAPVTIQYFGDLQCPICRDFTLGALPAVIQKWVRAGKVRIEYRSLETATKEPEVFKLQQIAALAAGKQNKMWHYLELFYHEQGEEDSGYVNESYLQSLARQVPGLNLSQWTSDRNNSGLATQVVTDAQAANTQGFNGTPSFLIGKTNGTFKKFEPPSLTDPTGFDEAIEAQLKE